MNKLIAMLFATLLIAGCYDRTPTVHSLSFDPNPGEKAYYGKSYWVKVGSDFMMDRQFANALIALSQGLHDLRRIRPNERCGTSRKFCIAYKVMGYYLRAKTCAVLNKREMAIKDLMWLHNSGYLRVLAAYFHFWEDPLFESIKDDLIFQELVSIYKK